MKTLAGRGRKRAEWKNSLHNVLLEEFIRLRACGVKVSCDILRGWALEMLQDDSFSVTADDVIQATGKSVDEAIDAYYIQDLLRRYNIFNRMRNGKKQINHTQTVRSHREVAFHLGVLMRSHCDEKWDARNIDNYDESHFVFVMENGRVLDFKGEKSVSYAEVSSGRDKFTVCLRISGAPQCFIEPAMVIYQNNLRRYPILAVAPQPGICYRSQPRVWMDQQLFTEYFKEPNTLTA